MYILEAAQLRDVILMVPLAGVDLHVSETDENGEVVDLFTVGYGHGRHELRDLTKYVPAGAEISFKDATPFFRNGERANARSMYDVLETAANPNFKPTKMSEEMVRMQNDINKLAKKLAAKDDKSIIASAESAKEREEEREAEKQALIEEKEEQSRQEKLDKDKAPEKDAESEAE